MERSAAARVLPSRSTKKLRDSSMTSTTRTSAEKEFAQLQNTNEAARDPIEKDAAARAEKIARLRRLRLAAFRDESKPVTRTKNKSKDQKLAREG
jgi:hypothetical protein